MPTPFIWVHPSRHTLKRARRSCIVPGGPKRLTSHAGPLRACIRSLRKVVSFLRKVAFAWFNDGRYDVRGQSANRIRRTP